MDPEGHYINADGVSPEALSSMHTVETASGDPERLNEIAKKAAELAKLESDFKKLWQRFAEVVSRGEREEGQGRRGT